MAHRTVQQALVAGVLLLFSASAMSAADPWLGTKVFKKRGSQPKVGNRTVDSAVVLFPATVSEVNGEWLWVGRAWIRKTDVLTVEQALDYYTDEIRREPSGAAFNARGNVWQEKGELDNAIKDHTEAIRLGPTDDAAYNNRGNAFSSRGEYDRAIQDYTEAIRLNPRSATKYFNRGNTFASKGEYDRAIQDYTEAMRLDTNEPMYCNALAWLQATCPDERYRNGHAAVEHATKACELSAWKDWNRLDTLAAAHAEAGDFKQAIRWQEKAIELATDEKAKSELRAHLELYKAGRPYHEEPKGKQ